MKAKELKAILENVDDDLIVLVSEEDGLYELKSSLPAIREVFEISESKYYTFFKEWSEELHGKVKPFKAFLLNGDW